MAGWVELRLPGGRLADESWAYVVLSGTGRVLHVGATGLPPMVRLWLHLNDPDPAVGRLRVEVDADDLLDAVVVAVEVPAGVDRRAVRDLVRRWSVDDEGSAAADPTAGPVVPGAPGGAAVDPVGRCAAELVSRVESSRTR